MCGIIGQIRFEGRIDQSRFNTMRDTMAHRGPDGYGSQFLHDGRLALGHRRLSILDLSADGHQPMTNEDGTIWLTFNGEIYNFKTLKEVLVREGHHFHSLTDSEVLIHGYEQWGIDGLLQRLKGMFAFAIWDAGKKELLLARDRFGIKPVMYYHDTKQFVFASEIKAITKDPSVAKDIRPGAIADYFIYSYVPHPNTVWKGIHKLRPAQYLRLNVETGEKTIVKYWEPKVGNTKMSESDASDRFRELLGTSVREHLVSDVPVGVFLSGGYDSSAVLMHMRETGAKVDSFSLGFAGSDRSEHLAAATIAKELASEHHVRLLEKDDELFPLIEKLVRHYDEPFAVSSQLTYHHVAELAAQSHKVVMGGDGGDEVLAGYTWYKRLAAERYKPRKWARAFLGRASIREQFLTSYNYDQTGAANHLQSRNILNDELTGEIAKRRFNYFDRHFSGHQNFIKSIQRLDIDTFMLDNCLQRADMSSMLHSLEVRVPFLDHELFEFIYSLHPSVYFDPSRNKKLLQADLMNKLSPSILGRPKQGFGFQHREALRGKRYEDFVNHGEMHKLGILSGPVDFQSISGVLAFHLVFLEQWFRIN